MRQGSLTLFLLTLAVLHLSQPVAAALQQHTFTVTGDNGETGGGTITWDDAVNPAGSVLDETNVERFELSISGGNVAGGSDSFVVVPGTIDDCAIIVADATPDFSASLAVDCRGANNVVVFNGAFTHSLRSIDNPTPVSTLTVTPGTTVTLPQTPAPMPVPVPVPVLSIPVLGLLAAITLGFGLRRLRGD
jgi:hypothetical protein